MHAHDTSDSKNQTSHGDISETKTPTEEPPIELKENKIKNAIVSPAETILGNGAESQSVQPKVHFQSIPIVNESHVTMQCQKAQKVKDSSDLNSDLPFSHGSEFQPVQLPRSTTGSRGRCGTRDQSNLSRFGVGGDPKTTGCEHPSTMGRDTNPIREVPGQDLRRSILWNHAGYTMQVKNRRAVAAWLRNFQMYSRARIHYDNQYVQKMASMGQTVSWNDVQRASLTPSSTEMPKATPVPVSKTVSPVKSEGWIKVDETPTKPSRSEGESLKRMAPKSAPSQSSQSMTTEANPQRVQQLQTQIAILQRELAKETQVPGDSKEP
eukprot:s25_g30.t1